MPVSYTHLDVYKRQVYNLPGLNGPLQLRRDTYAALLMGRIPRWNDARIQATNPGLNLPDREIVLVARLDSSGTTYALSLIHICIINSERHRTTPGSRFIQRLPSKFPPAFGIDLHVDDSEGVEMLSLIHIWAVAFSRAWLPDCHRRSR